MVCRESLACSDAGQGVTDEIGSSKRTGTGVESRADGALRVSQGISKRHERPDRILRSSAWSGRAAGCLRDIDVAHLGGEIENHLLGFLLSNTRDALQGRSVLLDDGSNEPGRSERREKTECECGSDAVRGTHQIEQAPLQLRRESKQLPP